MKDSENKVSDGERGRQALETRNERVLNSFRCVFFAFAFVGHGSNLWFGWANIPSSPLLLALMFLGLLGSLALEIHLRGDPPYLENRKYLLCTLEVVLLSAVASLITPYLPRAGALLVTLVLYLVTVILAGLRYSPRAVVWVGALALFLQFNRVRALSGEEFRNWAVAFSAITLGVSTGAVSLLVKSLLRLHDETVLQRRLHRFLAPELVAEVARDQEMLTGRVKEMTATVLFTDIRGFTPLSERLEPVQVVEFLNRFLEEMTNAVMDNRGMLDKYIGDAVMAVFGVPVESGDHADAAVSAALQMRARLKELNRELVAAGLPRLAVGIGIHTGTLVVGAIGSRRRSDYTVIGDTVNVASRLESLNRRLDTDILLSQATRDRLKSEYPLREVGKEKVKGRESEISVYTVNRGE